MEHPVIQCEDRGHVSSGETHEPTLTSTENNIGGAQSLDLLEIITIGNKDNGSKLETLPVANAIDEQLQNGSEDETLSNTNIINIINGARRDFLVMSMDSCVAIPKNSEINLNEGLSQHLGLEPHDLDYSNDYLVYDLPKTSGDSSSHADVPENLVKSNKEQEVTEPQESSKLLIDEDCFERECPICTELYDASSHKQSLLNCNHTFCDNCIKTMVNKANKANLGRVVCPLCRQTTPMMEWEIRKMQDQMMDSGGLYIQQDYVTPEAIVRRPGLCGALEYRFQKRIQNGRLVGFSPCTRNPQRLMERLNRLKHHCHCLYLCALAFLLFAEFFCFFFLFMPIVIFILLIVFGK